MGHRILREGGARDEGAAHRDGEGRAGLEGVEAGILPVSYTHLTLPTILRV